MEHYLNTKYWLSHKYDKNLYRHQIIEKFYDDLLKLLNYLELDLKVSDKQFYLDFINFFYRNTKYEYEYKYNNSLIYIKNKEICENYNVFVDKFNVDILNLFHDIKNEIDFNGLDLLRLNNINELDEFIDLIFKNVIFHSIIEDLEEEDDNDDYYYD
jgi:hypothetical protein